MTTFATTIPTKYAITQGKKADLDRLALQITKAQYEVNKFQSIVTSLTNKVSNFQSFLSIAENTRTETYNNKLLVSQLVQSAFDLQNNALIATGEMQTANGDTQNLAGSIKTVINELIFSADVLNKLANIITRKKATNPLISDELMTLIATAGKDANNAIALTLIALKSTFAAEASNMEAAAAISFTSGKAATLYQTLVGPDSSLPQKNDSLEQLLYTAYNKAKANYVRLENAVRMANGQLSEAQTDLAKAQVTLKSLQLGFAAANAAAMAS